MDLDSSRAAVAFFLKRWCVIRVLAGDGNLVFAQAKTLDRNVTSYSYVSHNWGYVNTAL